MKSRILDKLLTLPIINGFFAKDDLVGNKEFLAILFIVFLFMFMICGIFKVQMTY